MILTEYGAHFTDYLPFFIILITVTLPIYLIYKAICKSKYNKAYKLQLIEEQNELLRKMAEDKVKD